MAEPIVLRPGEGEPLFGGRIVLKSALPELTITESFFPDARPGAAPHVHRGHADAFYVLDGHLAFLVDDEEHTLGPGGFVYAPPGVVHGFRSLSPARFLNFHTPDARFADALRERDRGGPGPFDSVDAAPGSGLPATAAILLDAGKGEILYGSRRVATIKVGSDELSLIEFDLDPAFGGPDPHTHDDHTDSFYVVRRGDAGGRAHVQERPDRSPPAEHPRAGRRLHRPAAEHERRCRGPLTRVALSRPSLHSSRSSP
jgi:quercetin dioxygenase-like cupin family protein